MWDLYWLVTANSSSSIMAQDELDRGKTHINGITGSWGSPNLALLVFKK